MIIPTKEQVFKAYVIEKNNTRECAEKFKMSQPWFRKYMKEYGIKSRKPGEYDGSNKGKKFSIEHRKKMSESMRFHYANLKDRSRPNNRTGSFVRCNNCGEEIWRKKCHIENNKKIYFCSSECHGEWKSKNLIGKENPRFNSIEKNCGYCGTTILCKPSRIKRLKRGYVFCNPSCHDSWRRENIKGEMLYNWKGGYAPYYGENWLIQRRLAWERDEFTCQRCGNTKEETNRNPDVHHKKPFREFGLKNYKEANDLSNLVCLCNKCHKIVEENEDDFFNLKFKAIQC